jgi:hypothetical protein
VNIALKLTALARSRFPLTSYGAPRPNAPLCTSASAKISFYDKASKIAHYAMENDLTLKAAARKLGF